VLDAEGEQLNDRESALSHARRVAYDIAKTAAAKERRWFTIRRKSASPLGGCQESLNWTAASIPAALACTASGSTPDFTISPNLRTSQPHRSELGRTR
jgi:hypothetical protein